MLIGPEEAADFVFRLEPRKSCLLASLSTKLKLDYNLDDRRISAVISRSGCSQVLFCLRSANQPPDSRRRRSTATGFTPHRSRNLKDGIN